MAAARRLRPLPSSSSSTRSSARNPFDSSDEEDDGNATSGCSYSNPFDDADGDCRADARTRRPRAAPRGSKHQPADVHARNPFDDEDEEEDRKQARAPSLKSKLDQGTLFDEDLQRADVDTGKGPERKSKTRSPADAALKKAQRFKDAGTSQASKMVEGGLHQAHRLKESSYNAFKPSDGSDEKQRSKPLASTPARNQLLAGETGQGLYDKGQGLYDKSQGLYAIGSHGMAPRTARYDDHQFQGPDLEQRSVQELEGYAVQKSEDTTKHIHNCLKVAEDIKADATRTMINLHQQGEQVRRTHELAFDIDQNLTAGEKLLGNLGGMFSRTWKPKKGHALTGPVTDANDDSLRRKGHHLEQRTALGLDSKGHNNRPSSSVPDSYPQTTQAKLEMEKTKQDDALSDLSNVLDQLKGMSIDMGSEIARQNVALDHFQNDVVSLDERVKGANVRGRRLLGK